MLLSDAACLCLCVGVWYVDLSSPMLCRCHVLSCVVTSGVTGIYDLLSRVERCIGLLIDVKWLCAFLSGLYVHAHYISCGFHARVII